MWQFQKYSKSTKNIKNYTIFWILKNHFRKRWFLTFTAPPWQSEYNRYSTARTSKLAIYVRNDHQLCCDITDSFVCVSRKAGSSHSPNITNVRTWLNWNFSILIDTDILNAWKFDGSISFYPYLSYCIRCKFHICFQKLLKPQNLCYNPLNSVPFNAGQRIFLVKSWYCTSQRKYWESSDFFMKGK